MSRAERWLPVCGGILLCLAATPLLPNAHQDPEPSGLSKADVTLIEEAFRLQGALGSEVWPSWGPMEAPVLYKTGRREFLVGHANPPERFTRGREWLLGKPVLVAASEDSNAYLAAFPFEGEWTVVVSRPAPDVDAAEWVIKAAHELFHVWQHRVREDRVVEPFVGAHASEHELSFPFPYESDRVRAFLRIEAEQVFLASTAESLPPGDARRAVALLGHIDTLSPSAFDDSLAVVYKKWMEWNEGVARYTERERATLASNPGRYEPSSSFAGSFPSAQFTELRSVYAGDLNPVRFVGEGVQGRIGFYYIGMGKAYLLDRLLPDWKTHYFEMDLDSLLAAAKSASSRALE